MEMQSGEEAPPKSTDLDGWRQAITDDRLKAFRLEALAAAFQDLGNRDTQVQHALAKHLSDSILKMLRKYVGFNHPNEGWDIIDRTHHLIFTALLNPKSADGRSLRVTFGSRVLFRVKDAIAAEQRERRTPDDAPPTKKKGAPEDQKDSDAECSIDINASAERKEADLEFAVVDDPDIGARRPIVQDDPLADEMSAVDEQINVKGILDCVSDPRKRMAFHLFMDGVPYKSKKKVETIAQALGISERTAREWVKEVRQLLAEHEGVKHLKKLRVGARS
jgi:DNA-directed RNA polymerase specialized sigma24 family protein